MRRLMRVLAILTVLAVIASGIAYAAPKHGADDQTTYMVLFKEGFKGIKGLQQAGFAVQEDWEDFIGAAAVRTGKAGAERLERMPFVEAVEPEVTFHKMELFTDQLPITWGLDAVNAPEAWAMGAKGQSIRVCILDTGIDYDHPEFFFNGTSIIKGSKNFMKDRHPDARDGDGHGTHVAGTIAAQGALVNGVAPNVELYIARVLGDDGYSTSTSVINGVKWCADTVGADILSMSLGGGRPTKTEERTYNTVYNTGSLIIAAAGNAGDSTVSYPAGYTSVVSVAAVDSNLNWANFSQFNADVELAGPGVAVLSSVIRGRGVASTTAVAGTLYPSNGIEFAPLGTLTGPLVECGTAETTTSCTGIPADGAWIALVNRGNIPFADKATNVLAQGAGAMILANNDTLAPDDYGNFTFGTAGTWLPSVSVSYNSGVAIRAGGLGTGMVALEPWDYAYYQGTSMATPHVSAVAALAWSARPTLTNADIRSILADTAQDLGDPGRDVKFGYGLVQADAAVNAAKAH